MWLVPRVHKDIRTTVDLCQKVEAAGVSWITVHGRTADERHQSVHYDAIKTIKDSVSIPVIANGDIKSMRDAEAIYELTGADGACHWIVSLVVYVVFVSDISGPLQVWWLLGDCWPILPCFPGTRRPRCSACGTGWTSLWNTGPRSPVSTITWSTCWSASPLSPRGECSIVYPVRLPSSTSFTVHTVHVVVSNECDVLINAQ